MNNANEKSDNNSDYMKVLSIVLGTYAGLCVVEAVNKTVIHLYNKYYSRQNIRNANLLSARQRIYSSSMDYNLTTETNCDKNLVDYIITLHGSDEETKDCDTLDKDASVSLLGNLPSSNIPLRTFKGTGNLQEGVEENQPSTSSGNEVVASNPVASTSRKNIDIHSGKQCSFSEIPKQTTTASDADNLVRGKYTKKLSRTRSNPQMTTPSL